MTKLDPDLMDSILINEAFEFLASSALENPADQLAKISGIVRDGCPKGFTPKYRGMLEPIIDISKRIGFDFPEPVDDDAKRSKAALIDSNVTSIRRGHFSSLLKPFLAWAWVYHRDRVIPIFEAIGFTEYAQAEDRARERLAAQAVPIRAYIQERSPHDLDALFVRARERLVLVAQNHWYMINQAKGSKTDFWPKIANALSRGVSIEIVAMHRDTAQPIAEIPQADPILTWAQFMKVEEFGDHIDQCWETLTRYKTSFEAEKDQIAADAEALGHSAGTLELNKAWFLPFTLSFVDPDSPDSMAVISPRTSSPISGTRADFVITKADHAEIYSHFWNYVNHGKAHQKWALVWSSEQVSQ